MIGIKPVVAVQHTQILSGGDFQSGVNGRAVSAVFLVNKNNIIRKLLLIFADDVGGMVFAAVIHENCFEIRKRLVNQYGIQTAA